MGEPDVARNAWSGNFFAKYGFDIVKPPKIVNGPMKIYISTFVKVKCHVERDS